MSDVAIVWFRRDLRLADNPALLAAAERGRSVVPLFVHDAAFADPSGANRLAYLRASLDALSADLAAAGAPLVERTGDPAAVLADLVAELGGADVFAAEDFGPLGRRRDQRAATALEERGSALRLVGTPYAVAPGSLHTRSGGPFKVFTPFSRAWRQHGWDGPVEAPARVCGLAGVASGPVPATPEPEATEGLPPAGERAAHDALERFLAAAVEAYKACRDRPDLPGTSQLSPHLKWGTIHPRQVLAHLGDGPGPATFASEVCWREFYADVLFHRPDTVRVNFVEGMDGIEWDEGAEADRRFAAWCEGRTGYPIVDAGMRQLVATGWMHNRVRMIVASFLVKDLHLHWRRGAAWFMRHLVDGDVASNAHGWQWTAGTGTDASPFFRVFNPITQGRRFDPDGAYVRRWVPELRHLDGPDVHEPWRASAGAPSLFVADAGAYPDPIVDHAVERAEALERYGRR